MPYSIFALNLNRSGSVLRQALNSRPDFFEGPLLCKKRIGKHESFYRAAMTQRTLTSEDDAALHLGTVKGRT